MLTPSRTAGTDTHTKLADPLLHLAPPGTTLRQQLATSEAALKDAKAAEAAIKVAMDTEGEALRLQLGGMKQRMATNTVELEKEREVAAAMKERVVKLNINFTQTSGWPGLGWDGCYVCCWAWWRCIMPCLPSPEQSRRLLPIHPRTWLAPPQMIAAYCTPVGSWSAKY